MGERIGAKHYTVLSLKVPIESIKRFEPICVCVCVSLGNARSIHLYNNNLDVLDEREEYSSLLLCN